jgi:dipeptidyl aminopeptidase/acylaminoacyl peptidase
MPRLVVAFVVATLALPSVAGGKTVAHKSCATTLPPETLPPGQRALVPEDLVRLRDIGPSEPQYFPAPAFTISPDGRWAAFQLRRAEPTENAYCLAMVILDLAHRAAPRIVDQGGEPLLMKIDLRGIAEIPNGWMKTITPRWSSDGKWIAFLKSEAGKTQVWRAFADGSGSAPVTHSSIDVTDFDIAPDGTSIIYATLPGIDAQAKQIEEEGLSGWHYDDRFAPWIAKRPLPRSPVERAISVLDPVTGKVRSASAAEAAVLGEASDLSPAIQRPDSKGLEISGANVFGVAPAGGLHARLENGSIIACTADACAGATRPWWIPGHRLVRYFRSEGWGKASTAIYEWTLTTGKVRRLYRTDDVLGGCTPRAQLIICLRYSSLQPGRLVQLDPASGKSETLFDPNPEFTHLTLGTAIRLHWRNAFGIETLGDLVLPVGYRQGQRYPMVVVQYDTRGFLRGGTGDEYPIQAFANRGYAVLSFRRPELIAEFKAARTTDEVGRIDLQDFADRRSVQSSLEGGVRIAIARGIADPKQIGITGLSDGTSTVEWALIHSSLFSAAAVSSCCWDPAFEAHVGPSAARHFRAEGWPGVLESEDPFWKQVSLLENARRISTPILVNASDEELLGATLSYTGLREADVPIDMFVYPGEFHARWQPAHRLAAYRRSLDWFDYWLRGMRSDAPDRQGELRRWDRLKKQATQRPSI